jgi:ABC-type uncharacterized transport system permease subunit
MIGRQSYPCCPFSHRFHRHFLLSLFVRLSSIDSHTCVIQWLLISECSSSQMSHRKQATYEVRIIALICSIPSFTSRWYRLQCLLLHRTIEIKMFLSLRIHRSCPYHWIQSCRNIYWFLNDLVMPLDLFLRSLLSKSFIHSYQSHEYPSTVSH